MAMSGSKLRNAARGALIAALGVTVYGMMTLTFIDVAGRYLFNSPLGGAKALTEILLALMVFGAAPLVTATRSHITTALFESAMKGGVLKVRNGAIAVVSAAVLAWRLWVQAVAMAELKGGTPLLGVPLAPIFYAMAVLSGICAVLTLTVAILAPPKPASEIPT